MGLLNAWFGPDTSGEVTTHGQVLFASRIISVSDLQEVEAELKRAFSRVEISRSSPDYGSPGTALVEPIDRASDEVLRGVMIEARNSSGDAWPSFRISLGQDRQADALTNPALSYVDGGHDDAVVEMRRAAAARSVEIIAHAGRRVLNRRQWRDLARVAVALVYLAVLVGFARSVWPHVLWAVVAGIAGAPTAAWVASRLVKWTDRVLADSRSDRVIVRHQTREEWRDRRHKLREKWTDRGVGLIVGAAGALLTKYVVDFFTR